MHTYCNIYIVIAGDLNSRTKDFLDFIPYDDLDFVFGETDYPGDMLTSIEIPKIRKLITNLACPLLTYVVNMMSIC